MKNFIRGCGAGILIATLILAITYMLVDNEISDSEVIARAQKLGMVEADSMIVRQQEATPESVEPDNESADGSQPEEDALQQQEGDNQEALTQTPSEEEPAVQDTPQPQADNAGNTDTVTVTINSGQDGVTICSMLQDKGVIEDAADFSSYLSQNQLQMKIRAGTFELKKGMSYEELVKKIVW